MLPEAPPDHSTISRTRRLIDLETHEAVFTWMLQRLADAGLVKGKTVGIDATTLEANAALRSIVRRDTGESYQDFLTELAQASGIETPTRADLARIDRKRKKKGSNDDWTHPQDPDAKITKMKDGRTHLAHKAEHAVDLETGAIVGVTVQDADEGDTTTSIETLIEAAEQIEAVRPDGDGIQEVVGDKGYHSNQSLVDLEAVGVRSYISEPDRGRRNWKKNPDARDAVYRNRRRIRGPRGLRLLRLRGERLERPSPISMRPAGCAACICAATPTLRFLVGTWEGTSSGRPGNGVVQREYRLVLRDRFIEGRTTSTYPPQEKNAKGEVHEDIAYFSYDRSTKAFKMRQFHVEGFVTEYVATSTGASEVVFNSESLENIPVGWRARETWRITGADSFVEVFELAEPGKDFTVYSETRLTRRR